MEEINFEILDQTKVMSKRKRQMKRRSLKTKTIGGCIVNILKENLNKITVQKQNSF